MWGGKKVLLFLSSFPVPDTLQDGLNHLVTHLGGLGEHVLEECLCFLELRAVQVEVAVADDVGPLSRGHCELQIVLAERDVLDGDINAVLQEAGSAEEILGDAEEDSEERRRADDVIVGNDT